MLWNAACACAQSLDLPFHWQWRDFEFVDSLAAVSELEVMAIEADKGNRKHMLWYHWIKFDSLGRAVEESVVDPEDASTGTIRRFRWVYDSTGCPVRHILVGGRFLPHPSDRYQCENGKLILEKLELKRGFAIKRYLYGVSPNWPSSIWLYRGTCGTPYDAYDTLRFHHRLQDKGKGFEGQYLKFTIEREERRTRFMLDEWRGPLLRWLLYPGEFGVPERIVLSRRDFGKPGWRDTKTMYFRPLYR